MIRKTAGPIALVLAAGLVTAASAQTPVQPQPRDPNMPGQQNTLPEKVPTTPGDTTSSTGNLSERLQRSDGVITPPATGSGNVITPSDTSTTPVIPPAGSPGSSRPNAEPK